MHFGEIWFGNNLDVLGWFERVLKWFKALDFDFKVKNKKEDQNGALYISWGDMAYPGRVSSWLGQAMSRVVST